MCTLDIPTLIRRQGKTLGGQRALTVFRNSMNALEARFSLI
jgi:hypothetical protein